MRVDERMYLACNGIVIVMLEYQKKKKMRYSPTQATPDDEEVNISLPICVSISKFRSNALDCIQFGLIV